MNRNQLIAPLLAAFVLATHGYSQQTATPIARGQVPEIEGLAPGARSAADSIDAEKIRAHVRFLSLDQL